LERLLLVFELTDFTVLLKMTNKRWREENGLWATKRTARSENDPSLPGYLSNGSVAYQNGYLVNSGGGGGGAPSNAQYLLQTSNTDLPYAQVLDNLPNQSILTKQNGGVIESSVRFVESNDSTSVTGPSVQIGASNGDTNISATQNLNLFANGGFNINTASGTANVSGHGGVGIFTTTGDINCVANNNLQINTQIGTTYMSGQGINIYSQTGDVNMGADGNLNLQTFSGSTTVGGHGTTIQSYTGDMIVQGPTVSVQSWYGGDLTINAGKDLICNGNDVAFGGANDVSFSCGHDVFMQCANQVWLQSGNTVNMRSLTSVLFSCPKVVVGPTPAEFSPTPECVFAILPTPNVPTYTTAVGEGIAMYVDASDNIICMSKDAKSYLLGCSVSSPVENGALLIGDTSTQMGLTPLPIGPLGSVLYSNGTTASWQQSIPLLPDGIGPFHLVCRNGVMSWEL